MENGVPPTLAYWLEDVNTSQPILQRKLILDESKVEKVNCYKSLKDYSYNYNSDLVNGYWNNYNIPKSYCGVPQGSKTGPLLALLPIKKFIL